MDTLKELLHKILNEVAAKGYRYRVAVKVMMATVVFVTTYMLILPAITLELDKAAEQGGIDVPAVEQTVEQEVADTENSTEASDNDVNDKESSESVGETDTDKEGDAAESDQDSAMESSDEQTDEQTDESKASEPTEKDIASEMPPLTFEGKGFTVEVADPQNVLPEQTELSVNEITSDDKGYDKYCSDALAALKDNAGVDSDSELNFVRLYDIKLISGDQTIEPDESVEVTITYDSEDKSNTGENALKVESEDCVYVVHFTEDEKTGEEQAEVLDKESTSFQVRRKQLEEATFEADSFSVYAIVEAPDPVPRIAADVSELIDSDEGFLLSMNRNNTTQYILNSLKTNGCFNVVNNDPATASKWFFEDAGNNTFYISTYVNGVKKYISNPSGNNAGLVNEDSSAKTKFEITSVGDGTFYLKISGEDKWLQYSGSGSGVRFYTDNNNDANSKITITYSDTLPVPTDPYKLDGKSYGIAYHNGETSAAALTATAKTTSRLASEDLLIRPDILDNDGILLVDEGKDMIEWTFEKVDADYYHITTIVDDEIKYLTITNNNITLENSPDEVYSKIKVTPGTGDHKGEYSFSVNNHYLNSISGAFNGVTGSQNTSWLNLVEKTDLDDDDFTYYTARKVSVSDNVKVKDGDAIILYTRIWNETTMKYDFFVVDHDGTLLPCHDNGDSIEWIGSSVNTSLWELTEHTYPDGSPSYFYELQNTQYGKYIAPQVSVGESGQILSDNMIGINMNGRRDGANSTTIIAWDDDQYAYSSLKTENGRIVPCTLSDAEDFYFAIIHEPDPEEPITTVPTVDNNLYGITMKMVDFNNSIVDERDSVQFPFFGGALDEAGLLSTNLDGEGYPSTTEKTGHVSPVSDMFTGMTTVNHLFLQSIYNESGYFEYDSTQNFAHLKEDGDFIVYDQLAATDKSTRPTRTHGQFMPYNDIDPDNIITEFTNQTDVKGVELPDTDPRKGETLYRIPLKQADYFFGMEMEATFTQTASGLDAWGHDIIFEFSGDDDFWFYVDGELVLDLGGVHSAMSGSINFRTGEIKSDRGDSTLYDTFRNNFQARGMSESEINSKLEELFKQNENGQYVFKDYTNHTMKMFYMERGAGASNLHMRFNLAAVEPGSFLLSKNLSGTDSASNDLIEFPYQIHYKTVIDGIEVWRRLGDIPGEEYGVTYKDSTTNVKFARSYTPAGGTQEYNNVFFLKPGQAAQVKLPEGAVSYYVVECGVNPDVYDKVYVNKENDDDPPITGTATVNKVGETARRDYSSGEDTLENRQRVDYENHVSEGAVRSLSFTKVLYDSDGIQILSDEDDPTLFSFRLFLGNESASTSNIPAANLYKYYVRDKDGYYCRFNAHDKKFESLPYNNFSDLLNYLNDPATTAAEKDAIIFITSPNGSISKIPADHTVEVRDLIVDSKYKILERSDEIPKGYTLRLEDGYTRTDTAEEIHYGEEPIVDVIKVDEDPEYEIRNQKGWGLTVEKKWSDKDFMQSHDDIFFAVYTKEGSGISQEPIEGSVHRLKSPDTELYYFFGNLQSETPFAEYVVREVNVTVAEGHDLVINDDIVQLDEYVTVEPIPDRGTLINGGTPVGGTHKDGYQYTVTYEPGEQTTHNENVRIDSVTNSRPGIEIYKTHWDYSDPLAGAVFTLKDSSGEDVAAPTYTSRDDGLVTIAYLNDGTYKLAEIGAPKGYRGLTSEVTITVETKNGHTNVHVTGDEHNLFHTTHENSAMAATIRIRNREAELVARKIDASTNDAISGVHFALYRQVTDHEGNPRIDYNPVEGYTDLVTDSNGIIPDVNMVNLQAGTYYLRETAPATGYDFLNDDICFTIEKNGTVTATSEAPFEITESEAHHKITSTLLIKNGKMKKVSFMKVDIADTDSPLADAKFDLYDVVDGQQADTPRLTELVSGSDGMLAKNGVTVFDLPIGTYHLVETKPPNGYVPKEDPVEIVVTAETDTATVDFNDTTTILGVTYDEGTTLSSSGKGIAYNNENKVYTMKISNTAGVELPSCGGIGTTIFYVIGALLFLASAAGLMVRLRREQS